MLYSGAYKCANLLKLSLVSAAAMLAVCLQALVGTTDAAEATSLPQNGKIAFISSRDNGTYHIYTAEPDGSNVSQLTHNSSGTRPKWSPDGTKLTFSDGRGDVGIPVMSADGSNLRYVQPESNVTGALSFFPTWSPDGTKLAFSGRDSPDTPFDIYTMDLDGSNQTNLTNNSAYSESDAEFSPDGSQMCFSFAGVVDSKPASGIYLMNDDGSDPTTLVSKAVGECDWSPDDTKIAFGYTDGSGDTSDEAYGDSEVAVINPDGSGLTNLTSNSATDVTPRWSPDGTKIAFMSDRDGDQDIYTMDADGSDVALVTTDSGSQVQDLDPDWQPLPGTTSPKDADGSDEAQITKKPGVEDVDRDRPERTVIVKPGDSLWSISEERLGPEASPQRVYDHTYQMYALNRERIGSDPDLIFVGQRLSLPLLGEG